MSVILRYSDYLLGTQKLTVDDYVANLDAHFLEKGGENSSFANLTRDEVASILRSTTGIKNVCVGNRENEPIMFCEILDKYFQAEGASRDEIDCIIYTKGNSIAGNVNVPYYLQNSYKMQNAQVFCIGQECCATLLAINLGRNLIKNGSARRVLILTSNFFESFERRFMGLFLVSDGIGLLELSCGTTGLSPLDFTSATNGSFNKVQDLTSNALEVVDIGVKVIKSLLKKNDLTISDISLIIPQNTNVSGWNVYTKKLGIEKAKIYSANFGGSGHMGDVDMIRNITDIERADLLQKDELAIAYALGTGTSWNALLLKKMQATGF